MNVMHNFPPGAVLIVGALCLPLLPKRSRATAFLIFPVLAFALLLVLETGTSFAVSFLNYKLVLTRVDRLSLAFGYVFTIVTCLGGIYAFHLKETGQQVAALWYAGSALGVVFAGDLFTLYVFWEMMAISSVYLIWARRSHESSKAGTRYILVHIFGGSMLLAGILWHLGDTGSLAFNRLEAGPAVYFILFGFALNAAVPPLHAWLPDAYPEGTVTGSVFLSAFTTKAAVYVLARGFAGWEILMWAGVFMAVYGVVFAFLENDIRRILGYHIISQVGYMVTGVGLGTEAAINGATAHAFAHILYKGLLFMGAGTVLYTTGRSKLTELGGLSRAMPLVLLLYMVGALSISGFPLSSGFVSKSLVIHAAELSHQDAVFLLLTVASVGTFLSIGLKLPYFTWFGPNRSLEPTPVPWGMYVGMILAGAINVAIGVYPELLYAVMPFPVHYRPYNPSHLMETIQLLTFTGLAFWLLIGKIQCKSTITLDFDWFYRKPAGMVYDVAVGSVNRIFDVTESLGLRFVRTLARLSIDPVGHFLPPVNLLGSRGWESHQEGSRPRLYDPDYYRLPVGVIILVLLLSFVVLLAWDLSSS
ncbi:MAG: Na(+)/H(+) antiporter subunit D [Candidatus Binatia bacterium]